MRYFAILLLTTFWFVAVYAQPNPVLPTNAESRLKSFGTRNKIFSESMFRQVPFRSVGPTVMSGRVVDISAHPHHPEIFLVAYASGGLWLTRNNGQSFEPIFDTEAAMTIGDIAVRWGDTPEIWIGTGENNSSRSSYSGTGIYRSNDFGKTWQHLGLAETHHIGRIVLHPDNPDVAWVAAIGHLYSVNKERGVYKTTDRGKSWTQVLNINEDTGVIDLIADPQNADVLYASAWQRSRRAWNFEESGNGSGIYKSADGGQTWHLLTDAQSSFPTGAGVGRIGLAISGQNSKRLYAFLDNQAARPQEKDKKDILTKDELRTMDAAEFLALSEEKVNLFLDEHNFPQKYFADTLFGLVKTGALKPADLVFYLEDANGMLFDTPIIGGEVYKSSDGGHTWQKTHPGFLDNLVYTFGYYFGQLRVNPANDQEIFVLGVPILHSADSGQSFKTINMENVHVDHHALWINPDNPKHMINGNDGGLNLTYDGGQTWINLNHPPVGQFYTVAIDMAKPFNIYGGLQDNGVWVGPSTYRQNKTWLADGQYPYKNLMGGDGMQIAVDSRDNATVYCGYQFGNYYRMNRHTGEAEYIQPQHELGQRPLRFNWQTPIHLSVHNQDILYLGSNKLHRSLNKGQSWEAISGDLTKGGKKGDVPYGTLTSISESPLQFGLIYTGSDDGLIYLTRDGGGNWELISKKLPDNFWVSRVIASQHTKSRVYVTLNGYRWDNFESLVFGSDDFGKTWRKLGLNLPAEPVNVIREDPVNEKILYLGTDHGLYISIDGAESFYGLGEALPDVPVHDLAVHPRDKKLVVGTHGRSIFMADIGPLQLLADSLINQPFHLYPVADIQFSKEWGNRSYDWQFSEAPGREIIFWSDRSRPVKTEIWSGDSLLVYQAELKVTRGLNYNEYDLTTDSLSLSKLKPGEAIKPADNGKFYLTPGTFMLRVSGEHGLAEQIFEIKKPKKTARRTVKKIP